MITKKSKGFTIIELIVVIAIIAILAAIVLVNVTQYITKAKDSSAKGDLATLMTDMADYYNTSTAYPAAIGTSTGNSIGNVYTALTGTGMGYTLTYNTSGTPGAYCAAIAEKSLSTNCYCVDSTGYKVEKTNCTVTNECPASGTCVQ